MSAWHDHAPDLSVATLAIQSSALFSAELLLVRSSLKNLHAATIRAADYGSKRSDVRSLCRASKARVCINTNFFDEEGKALGLIVSRGITQQRMHAGGRVLNGVFQVSRDRIAISDRGGFSLSDVLEAVQAGPVLIRDGKPVETLRDSQLFSRRAGVCVDRANRIVLYCHSSGLRGISMAELQHALAIPEIDCRNALNLDGGGSAQLYIDGTPGSEHAPIDIRGDDEVPVALGLFPRENSEINLGH